MSGPDRMEDTGCLTEVDGRMVRVEKLQMQDESRSGAEEMRVLSSAVARW